METVWLGCVEYRRALDLQLACLERRAEKRIPDTLLLLTHPHVYTFGRSGNPENLLVPPETLVREGISVEHVGRGGDVTYHGPGQLVGYPIVHLARPDLHRFVRSIEAALIEALARFDVEAGRIEGLTGVWTDGRKIASIGVGVKRWVTYHGFALNVSTDLSYFDRIHLCGLNGRRATSIREVTGIDVPFGQVRESVSRACGKHLGGFS